MEYYLKINEALKLVVPFEDLIIDGVLADVFSSTNCVVSAMGLGGEFLIGVTSLDATKPAVFEFNSNATGEHTLTDLSSGKPVQTVPSGKLLFRSMLAKTTVYRFALNADSDDVVVRTDSEDGAVDDERLGLKSDDGEAVQAAADRVTQLPFEDTWIENGVGLWNDTAGRPLHAQSYGCVLSSHLHIHLHTPLRRAEDAVQCMIVHVLTGLG